MAKLTLKKTTDLGDLSPGWKKVTISGAKRGSYDFGEKKKFIDITFEGYAENVKLRAHQKFNKTTKEEFCIANIFRYANAGISEVDGDQVEIDTSPENLIGKELQVYFYKNAKGYTDISDNVVPAGPFKNIAEEWTAEEVEGFKKTTYNNRIAPYISKFSNGNSGSWDAPSSNDSGPPVSEDDDWD